MVLKSTGSLIDVARWPIVVCAPLRPVSDEELIRSMADYSLAIADRLEPHVMLLDLRSNAGITPRQRRILTDHMKPGPDNIQPGSLGTAMVFTSRLLQGMLTAIFWIRKPPQQTKVFTTLPEAEAWCRELLRGAPTYDPRNPGDAEMLYNMATAGPRFARVHGLLPEGELWPSEKEANARWPHLAK